MIHKITDKSPEFLKIVQYRFPEHVIEYEIFDNGYFTLYLDGENLRTFSYPKESALNHADTNHELAFLYETLIMIKLA